MKNVRSLDLCCHNDSWLSSCFLCGFLLLQTYDYYNDNDYWHEYNTSNSYSCYRSIWQQRADIIGLLSWYWVLVSLPLECYVHFYAAGCFTIIFTVLLTIFYIKSKPTNRQSGVGLLVSHIDEALCIGRARIYSAVAIRTLGNLKRKHC